MKAFLVIAAVIAAVLLTVHFIKKRKKAAFERKWGLEPDKQDGPSTEEIIGNTGYAIGLDPWSKK